MATGQLAHAPVGGEIDRDRLLLASRQADQGLLDLAVHHPGTDQGGALLAALGRQALIASLGPGLQRHAVAVAGRTLDHLEGAALQAQVLDHLVDVGILDLRVVAHHLQLGHVDLAEIGHHFEGGHPLQLAFPGRLQLRTAGQLQRLLAHGRIEGLAQQPVQRLAAHLLAVALLDHLGRHAAGAETLDAHGAAQFAQAPADMGVQALSREGEAHAALEGAKRFDGNWHCGTPAAADGPRHDVDGWLAGRCRRLGRKSGATR